MKQWNVEVHFGNFSTWILVIAKTERGAKQMALRIAKKTLAVARVNPH